LELPYCIHHSRKPGPDKGWAEQEMGVLPNVRIGLRDFAVHIHILLQTHSGSLPLPRYGNQFIVFLLQQFVKKESCSSAQLIEHYAVETYRPVEV
jgi:hypothetical protein